jgi:hypothetical protein
VLKLQERTKGSNYSLMAVVLKSAIKGAIRQLREQPDNSNKIDNQIVHKKPAVGNLTEEQTEVLELHICKTPRLRLFTRIPLLERESRKLYLTIRP